MNATRSKMIVKALASLLPALALAGTASAQSVSVEPAGTLSDGRPVQAFVLTSKAGMTARILSYGGIITAIRVPDRRGRSANVVLARDAEGL